MADIMLYPKNTKTRMKIDLCGMWDFMFDFEGDGDLKDYSNGHFKGEQVPVPSSYNDFFTEEKYKNYVGNVWYKKEFYLNDEFKNKDINLRFDGAAHEAYVFLNGTLVRHHIGGFLPFSISINDLVKWNEKNLIVVKLNNELSIHTLPCGEVKVLEDGRKINKPYFDFFHYAGLIRPVRLVITPKTSITDISLNHKICKENSETFYSVKATGNSTLKLTVYDEFNKIVAASNDIEGIIKIENTKLWSPENPYLYKFVFGLYKEDKLIDEYMLDVGIRTIEIKDKELRLNGKPIYLKGFGRHEDFYISGRGENLPVMKRDFKLMKWINANSFRTSHYPYSEEEYMLADREGFLIIDELPAVGFFPSLMNAFDAGSGRKVEPFFEMKGVSTITLENHLHELSELILRDKNYASVIAWSLFNEPDTTSSDKAISYFKAVFDKCYELDIEHRPRSFSMIMSSTPDACKCYQFSDFIMLNRYYGWYTQGGSELDVAFEALDSELDKWELLNKPVVFTEYGTDTYQCIKRLPSVMWSENYQVEFLKGYHEIFDKHSCVCGEQIWNFADFETSEGIIRVNGNKKGVFTREREPKLSAFYLKQRWENLK